PIYRDGVRDLRGCRRCRSDVRLAIDAAAWVGVACEVLVRASLTRAILRKRSKSDHAVCSELLHALGDIPTDEPVAWAGGRIRRRSGRGNDLDGHARCRLAADLNIRGRHATPGSALLQLIA